MSKPWNSADVGWPDTDRNVLCKFKKATTGEQIAPCIAFYYPRVGWSFALPDYPKSRLVSEVHGEIEEVQWMDIPE